VRSRLLTDESGFGLIEVLVSAILVVTVSLGVLAVFDNASATSRETRARSQASGLAQQDQDRLRGTSPASLISLAGTSNTVTKTVANARFAVTTSVDWATDGTTGAPSCTGNNPPSYLKITSDVTGGGLPGPTHVKATSLVALPVGSQGGTLRVQIKNSAGVGVDGATVTITGPTTKTAQTVGGCALFAAIPVGTYTVQITPPTGQHYVDQSGNPSPTIASQGVYAGQITDTPTVTYAPAAKIHATFWTYANATVYSTQADRITVTNSSAPTAYFGTPRSGLNPVNLQSAIDTVDAGGNSALYPYSTTYGISAGECANEQKFLGYSSLSSPLAPGATANVNIPLNAIDVTAKYNGAALPAGTHARVWFKRTTAGCVVQYPAITSFRFTDGQDHAILGVPPGTYDICADYTTGGTTYFKSYASSPKAVNVAATSSPTANPLGEQNMSVTITNTTPGTCPA
jgi:Tfp pilus assembly protein PilV